MLRDGERDEEPFVLEVPPVSAWRGSGKRAEFHDQPSLQKNLIDGLECLPGQLDLFTGDSDHA